MAKKGDCIMTKSFKVGEEVLYVNPIAKENGDHRLRIGYILSINYVKVKGKKKEIVFEIGIEPNAQNGFTCQQSEIAPMPPGLKHRCEFISRMLPKDLRNFSSFLFYKPDGH